MCVACLTVFVNCLVKQFAKCLGVFLILLLNVMELLSVVGGALLDRQIQLKSPNSFHRSLKAYNIHNEENIIMGTFLVHESMSV